MWFFICVPNFIRIGSFVAELWRYSDFQDGSCVWFRAIVAHPQSASGRLCFVLKFRLDRIYSFWVERFLYFAILAWNCLYMPTLWSFLGHISPNYVIYCCNPQTAPSCAEACRLSHKAWKSLLRFDLGTCLIKRHRTGQSKKSQRVIFYLRPHEWICTVVAIPNVISNHACKVLNWNFQGLRFYRGSNFLFFYWLVVVIRRVAAVWALRHITHTANEHHKPEPHSVIINAVFRPELRHFGGYLFFLGIHKNDYLYLLYRCHKNLNIIGTLVSYASQTLMGSSWKNVGLGSTVYYAPVLYHLIQTCSLT